MAFYLGKHGNVRLRRGTDAFIGSINASINPDDVNTTLERLGVDAATDNLFTGDRVDIETKDSRGLAFIPASNWSSAAIENTFSAFVNVNAAGGLRLFPSFEDSINNTRSNEIDLQAFTGDPIDVSVSVRDVRFNILGNVSRYEFNTSRDSVDLTALSDKYKQQHSAGLISGSGRIECAFDYTTGNTEEAPMIMLQIIQRLDLGCAFDIALYLTDKQVVPTVPNIFYQTTAVTTSTGITVEAGGLVSCTIDFVTTEEIKLIIGKPSEYILKEDDDRIRVEQGLDFLLQEATD
jgi:hypothetical protein